MIKFLVGTVCISLFFVSSVHANPDGVVIGEGDLRITGGGNLVFSDGSVQSKAEVQGPQGVQGIQGPQGIQGIQGPPGPTTGQVTLAAICNALSASNKVLPSFCFPANLVSIAVSPINAYVSLGTNVQFGATGAFSDNSTQNLTSSVLWSSSNSSVADISNSNIRGNGLIHADAAGKTTITATSGNISGSTNLTVFQFSIFPLLSYSGAYITAGPDGNLWFAETDYHKIGKMTTAGVITEFTIPTGGYPASITAGPDGNLWFTVDTGKIDKITTAGVITEFTIPTGGKPTSITAGPDGNLWFTVSTGKIDKITTAGVITEFTIPTGGNPTSITAGPDGNLWFAEGDTDLMTSSVIGRVGRITTAGVITEFTIPTGGNPTRITAGPDGNLWFSVVSPNYLQSPSKIDKITTAGVFTEYNIPIADAYFPTSITAGPDGNLWFSNSFNCFSIGRVTTAGVFTAFFMPTTSDSIAVGPDGNFWLTAYNNIYKFTPPTP